MSPVVSKIESTLRPLRRLQRGGLQIAIALVCVWVGEIVLHAADSGASRILRLDQIRESNEVDISPADAAGGQGRRAPNQVVQQIGAWQSTGPMLTPALRVAFDGDLSGDAADAGPFEEVLELVPEMDFDSQVSTPAGQWNRLSEGGDNGESPGAISGIPKMSSPVASPPEILPTPNPEERSDEAVLPSYLQNGRRTPPTVSEYQQVWEWHLELGEALYLALQNSPEIAVQSYNVPIAKAQLMAVQDQFDPRFTTGHRWSANESRVASTVDTFGANTETQRIEAYGASAGSPSQLGLSKRLTTGGIVGSTFSTGRSKSSPAGAFATLNPAWRSGVSLTFTQPLGRGSGKRITLMPIRISQTAFQATELGFLATVQRLVRDVELAYWSLVFAKTNVDVRQQDLETAKSTYKSVIDNYSLGTASRTEISEAKLNYAVAIDSLQSQMTSYLEAERSFRQLLGLPGFDERRIVVSMPDGVPMLDVHWEESISHMLERRPDLIAQRKQLEMARMQFELAADGCKPDLRFESTVSKSGFDESFDTSIDQLLNGSDHSWSVGFSHTRPVHRYGARAATRSASLQWARTREITRSLEFAAVHALQSAYALLQDKVVHVERMKVIREASEERLITYEEKYKLGDLALELLIRGQRAKSDAVLQEGLARVELLQAHVTFEHARGTLLDIREVTIGPQEPKLSPAKPSLRFVDLPIPEVAAPEFPSFDELLKDAQPELKEILQQRKARPEDFRDMLQDAPPRLRKWFFSDEPDEPADETENPSVNSDDVFPPLGPPKVFP